MAGPGFDRFSIDLTGVTLLGVYAVKSRLAQGGMGSVWLAENVTLGTPAAVKVPDPAMLAREGFAERFAHEIRALTRFTHPNVVRILAAGEHEGVPYFVLEYLAGGSLKDRLGAPHPVQSPQEVLSWLRPIALALDHLHEQGVVHRDVKPSNIMFQASGHPVLSDFGIVKALEGTRTSATTSSQIFTPSYAAPEQVLGETATRLAPRIDQYALACTAFEALVGEPPFDGTAGHVLTAKIHGAPPDPHERCPAISRRSANALLRGLQRDPADRHATCSEMAAEFAAGLELVRSPASPVPRPAIQPIHPDPVATPRPRSTRPRLAAAGAPRWSRNWVLLAAVLAAAVPALAWVLSRPSAPEVPERPGVDEHARSGAQDPAAHASGGIAPPPEPTPAPNAPEPVPGVPQVPEAPPPAPEAPAPARPSVDLDGLDAGKEVEEGVLVVAGRVEGLQAGTVWVNGRAVTLVDGLFRTEIDTGPPGPFEVYVRLESMDVPEVAVRRMLNVVLPPLSIVVEEPTAGSYLTTREFEVSGRVEGKGVSAVQVGGHAAKFEGHAFRATVRAAADGPLKLTVEALRARGPSVTQEVAFHVDATPPRVTTTLALDSDNLVAGTEAALDVSVEDARPLEVVVEGRAYPVGVGGTVRVPVELKVGRRRVVEVIARDQGQLQSAPLRVAFRTRGKRFIAVPSEVPTIKDAVALASAGDAIELAAGVFKENVTIRKSLSLVGAGRARTEIQPERATEPALIVTDAAEVVIEGVRLRSIGTLDLYGPGWEAEGVLWDQSGWELRLEKVPPASTPGRAGLASGAVCIRVGDVSVKGFDHLWEAYLAGSERGRPFALNYQFANGTTLTEQCACNVLMLVDRARATLKASDVHSVAHVGVLVTGPDAHLAADDMTFAGGRAALGACRAANLRVTSCKFTDQGRDGILASGAGTAVDVSDCQFNGTWSNGVHLVGALDAHVMRCVAEGCGDGLSACGPGARVDAVNNVFSRNRGSGISYKWGVLGVISGNTCEHNEWHGISTCGQGTDPSIIGNTTRHNKAYGVVW